MGWGGGVKLISFMISCVLLVKNLALLTNFAIKKFIEQRETVSLRPKSYAGL